MEILGGAILSTGGQLGSGFSSPQVFISESDFLDNTVVSCSNQGSYTTWTVCVVSLIPFRFFSFFDKIMRGGGPGRVHSLPLRKCTTF